MENETKNTDETAITSDGVLPEVKVAEWRAWISINEKQPDVRDDFQTMLESQQISKKVWIKLKDEWKDKQGNIVTEIDGFFIIHNGNKVWSLDPCGTSQYYKLEIGTHWCEA